MINFYNLLFYGTFLLIGKVENIKADENGLYQALSALLCLAASHFLFIFGAAILIFPHNIDFDLQTIFILMAALVVVFWVAFIRLGRYRKIEQSYNNQKKKAFIIGCTVNGAMVVTYFVMGAIEIVKVI